MPTKPNITGRIQVHIVDPGATRTRMRALAFPGEEPESVKPPEIVAAAILERLTADAPTGEKIARRSLANWNPFRPPASNSR